MKAELSEELRGVFEKLIPHYEKCIKKLPLNYYERDVFLRLNKIPYGICWASCKILNIYIYHEIECIGRFFKLNDLWFDRPRVTSYKESKKALQLRVDAMKSLLKNGTINV